MNKITKILLQLSFYCVICGAIFLLFVTCYYHFAHSSESVETELNFCQYLKTFAFNHSFLLGIFSSFVGVLLTFFLVRPRLAVHPKLAWDNNNRLRLEITNKSLFSDLVNISVEMYFVRFDEKYQDTRYNVIPMAENNISVIHPQIDGKDDCNHIDYTLSGFVWDDKYQYILCRVIATHSITGVIRIIEKQYIKNDIKRGVFQKGEFFSYEKLYPTECCKCWSSEIKNMCSLVWEMSNCILRVIRPIQDYSEIPQTDYDKAISELNNLKDNTSIKMFPCLSANIDTIETMIEQVCQLKILELPNLNPQNREKREHITTILNKNLVFLTDKMDKDIWEYYKKENQK